MDNHLLQLALDADFYFIESHLKDLIPTRTLFTDVNELHINHLISETYEEEF